MNFGRAKNGAQAGGVRPRAAYLLGANHSTEILFGAENHTRWFIENIVELAAWDVNEMARPQSGM